MGDSNRGFDFAVKALSQAAGHVDLAPSLDELERLAKQTGRRKEQVDALRAAVEHIFDGDVLYRVLMKIATLARDELHDEALALGYFKRASEARTDSDDALVALEALYSTSQSHDALLEILERRTELQTDDRER
jgi:hypothetical protein